MKYKNITYSVKYSDGHVVSGKYFAQCYILDSVFVFFRNFLLFHYSIYRSIYCQINKVYLYNCFINFFYIELYVLL